MKPLTGPEAAILALIDEAASRGEKCPSNYTMADAIGYAANSISTLIQHLEGKGYITVERGNAKRVVTILATGARTAGFTEPKFKRPKMWFTRRVQTEPENPPVRIAPRDPCFFCAVPADRHDQAGCKQWRGMVA